jgi:hypothetical protein
LQNCGKTEPCDFSESPGYGHRAVANTANVEARPLRISPSCGRSKSVEGLSIWLIRFHTRGESQTGLMALVGAQRRRISSVLTTRFPTQGMYIILDMIVGGFDGINTRSCS